jgi:hypothetical protein
MLWPALKPVLPAAVLSTPCHYAVAQFTDTMWLAKSMMRLMRVANGNLKKTVVSESLEISEMTKLVM